MTTAAKVSPDPGASRTVADLPTGTVTFLLTDIEDSTGLVTKLRDGYADTLNEHRRLLRGAVEATSGQEIDARGDELFVVFTRASDAVAAALAAQRGLPFFVREQTPTGGATGRTARWSVRGCWRSAPGTSAGPSGGCCAGSTCG